MFPGQQPKHIYPSLSPLPTLLLLKNILLHFSFIFCACVESEGDFQESVLSSTVQIPGIKLGLSDFVLDQVRRHPLRSSCPPSFKEFGVLRLSQSDQNLGVKACKTERGQSSRVPLKTAGISQGRGNHVLEPAENHGQGSSSYLVTSPSPTGNRGHKEVHRKVWPR